MKSRALPLAIFIFLNSCSQIGLLTLNTAASLTGGYRKTKDIYYSEKSQLQLDIYQPRNSAEKQATVIFLHGGSWQSGKRQQYKFVAQALTSAGFVAVIPDYRHYPQVKFPDFVKDVAEAVRWVRSHINQYGGDPEKIFVMGHSAGAHIGAMLALDENYLRLVGGHRRWIRGFIGLAGPYDFLPFKEEVFKKIFGPPDRFVDSQPIHFVDGSEMPVLLLHGERDRSVSIRNSRVLAQKIRDRRGHVQEAYFDRADHIRILSALSGLLRKQEIFDPIIEFIRSH